MVAGMTVNSITQETAMSITHRCVLVAGIIVFAAAAATAQPADAVLCCSPDEDTVVAVVGNERIRMRDLDAHSKSKDARQLSQLSQQLHDFREEMLDDLVNERVIAQEAARLRVSVDVLLRDHLKVEPVTEADVLAIFDQVNSRTPPDSPRQNLSLEDARPMIVPYLEATRQSEARSRYIQDLKKEARKAEKDISIKLDSPRQRIPISPSDPSKGAGPVEIVQFADFQCPFCKQLEPVLDRILALFPGQVRVVWKDFPIPNHELAIPAAEAARCAHEQGRFWEYSRTLFAGQEALTAADFRKDAAAAGLDTASFDGCLASAKYRSELATAYERASAYGVAVTPTVFINGRMIGGLSTVETYQRIVLRELQRVTD
jgi:protein-disulfide isomerase